MTRHWQIGLAFWVAAFGSASPVAVAAPGVKIGVTTGTTKVAAFRGWVMWSQPTGTSFNRRYRLMQRYRGRTSQVPIHSRAGRGFDVDLGPDGRGGVVAVYSRCTNELSKLGCDLYRYQPRRHREAKLAVANTPGASEQLPSIWGSRVAFLRGVLPSSRRLVVVDLRTGRETPIKGGTPPVASSGPLGQAPTRDRYGPTAVELTGRHVAFTWSTLPPTCPGSTQSNGDADGNEPRENSTELWLVALGGERRRVAAGCSFTTLYALSAPSFSGNRLFFQYLSFDGELISRTFIRSEGLDGTNPSQSTILALAPFAQDGRYSYFTRELSNGRRELRRAILTFVPNDQQSLIGSRR